MIAQGPGPPRLQKPDLDPLRVLYTCRWALHRTKLATVRPRAPSAAFAPLPPPPPHCRRRRVCGVGRIMSPGRCARCFVRAPLQVAGCCADGGSGCRAPVCVIWWVDVPSDRRDPSRGQVRGAGGRSAGGSWARLRLAARKMATTRTEGDQPEDERDEEAVYMTRQRPRCEGP